MSCRGDPIAYFDYQVATQTKPLFLRTRGLGYALRLSSDNPQ